jgi:hypothetical protein
MSVEEVMAMVELHLVSEEDGYAEYESEEMVEGFSGDGMYFEFEDGSLVEYGGMAWV